MDSRFRRSDAILTFCEIIKGKYQSCDLMNIVLIGYRCSGKTEVGKILARELGMDFFDTDVLIEENSRSSIETIISGKGWDYFRKIEKKTIREVSRNDNLVIATGGGVVIDEENVENLKENGLIIWLNGKAEVLKERMAVDQRSGKLRPALTGNDPLEEIKQVLGLREPLYEQAANLMVDSGTLSLQDVAASVIKALSREKNGNLLDLCGSKPSGNRAGGL